MRKIDGKFHIEGGQIVKTSNGEPIPLDEPLFLLRARDRLALPLLRIYQELSAIDGCNDYHEAAVQRLITGFAEFAVNHPERMKQPSVTRGVWHAEWGNDGCRCPRPV